MKQYFEKSIIKRLVHGGLFAFSAKAGSGFLTIALTALVTRMLPPGEVGLFFLSFSTVAMVSLFARFGLDQLGIKLIGRGLAVNDLDAVKLLTLRIMKCVGGATLVWALLSVLFFDSVTVRFLSEYHVSSLLKFLFSLWLVVATTQILFSEIFRSFQQIGYASLFSGGTAFGGFGSGLVTGAILVSFYFLHVRVTVEYIIAAVIVATVLFLVVELGLIVGILQFKGKKKKKHDVSLCPDYKRLIGQAFYFFMINLSIFSLVHVDTIILGFYQSEEDVAIYAATTRLVKLVTMSLIVIYEVVAPMVVELNTKNDKEQLQRVLRNAATVAAIPTTIVLIFFIVKAGEILTFLYGDYYKEGADVLIILSLGQLVNVWSGLSSYTLSITGHHKANMYITSFVAVTAIACCLIFVEEYGAIAVAWIISLAWIIQNIIAVIMTKYLADVWTPAGLFFSLKELRSYMVKKNSL